MDLPFDGGISRYYKEDAPKDVRAAVKSAGKNDIINPDFPYDTRWDKDAYEDARERGCTSEEAQTIAREASQLPTLRLAWQRSRDHLGQTIKNIPYEAVWRYSDAQVVLENEPKPLAQVRQSTGRQEEWDG